MGTNGYHRVLFERGMDGWWVLEATDIGGCYTQASSLREGRRRIREAMELWDVPRTVEHVETFELGDLAPAVDRCRNGHNPTASEVTQSVQALARAGLCKRDIRELLGLSTRRVMRAMRG